MKDELENEYQPAGTKVGTDFNYKLKYEWKYVVPHTIIQVLFLCGIYFMFIVSWKTFAWAFLCAYAAIMGTFVGGHRLYSHKAFKARYPLRLLLVMLQVIAGQYALHTWVRDHRSHHKYSDTDADPFNSSRGFFFAHIGSSLVRKHPAVGAYGKTIDVSDIEADPVVMFQKKYYLPLYFVLAVFIPIAVPMYFWNETFLYAYMTAYGFRYGYSLHYIWLVNSVSHMYGMRPYNKNILPSDSMLVQLLTWGEGYHNYHHAFASDYRSSELGINLNFSTRFIDLCAFLGLAYDLRAAPNDAIKRKMLKTGDGSRTTLFVE